LLAPCFTATQSGNRSRNTSSDAAADSDFSDTGGKFSSGRSPPGSPKAGANTSPTAMKKPQERTTSPPSKRRDKKTNAEASKLRNNISMMEYEVTRLNKSLRKRSTNLQVLESQGQMHTEEQMQAVLDYNSEIQALHTQIARLTARQQSLKDEYYELTGAHTSCPDMLFSAAHVSH
jgi:predicted RNase H-like nuclease (RuvC/YqgF family)